MYKLNLVELDSGSATVTGSELAIENCENGVVYLTTKPYINKLFRLMGYKSLAVVKILEEYAGKTISDIGDLKDEKIYVDETTQSFVVTDPRSVKWVNDLLQFLYDNFDVSHVRRYDDCYYWDQLTFSNSHGDKFAVYIDLCENYVQLLSLKFTEGTLTGISDEGSYSTLEGDSSLNSFITLVTSHVDISSEFHLDQKLSVYEYVDILCTLGYVSRKRKKYYKNDSSEEIVGYTGDLDYVLDDCNYKTWIQQRITESPNKATFFDACVLITMNLDHITYWSLRDFYVRNSKELSDMFALNN